MSSVYLDSDSKAYYVVEETFGTTPASPTMFEIPGAQIPHGVDHGNVLVRSIGSRDPYSILRGLRKPEMTVRFSLPDGGQIGFLEKADSLESMSIEEFYDYDENVISFVYKGMKMQRIVVMGEVEKELTAEAVLWGQDIAVSATKVSGADYQARTGGIMYDESFVQKGAEAGTGYVALDDVMAFRLEVNNNLVRVPVIRQSDGHLIRFLRAGICTMKGVLTFEFEDKDLMDAILADTRFSIKVGLGSTYAMAFTYASWGKLLHPTVIGDIVKVDASFDARHWWIA